MSHGVCWLLMLHSNWIEFFPFSVNFMETYLKLYERNKLRNKNGFTEVYIIVSSFYKFYSFKIRTAINERFLESATQKVSKENHCDPN